MGKIDLPAEPPKRKPVASSSGAVDDKKKKRKRTEKKGSGQVIPQDKSRQPGGGFNKGGQAPPRTGPNRPIEKAEPTEKEIQDQIKATLARLSGAGKTKSSKGDYWRQLVFYKLLLDIEGRYVFAGAELDFVQPDDKGRYHKEHFEVLESDVEELRATIEHVTHEILKLEFWDKTCDDDACEYCALRALMH